jgi:hypothetical protein
VGKPPLDPALGPTSYKYLIGAHYLIVDPDGLFAGAWIDHPATDRLPAKRDTCGFGGLELGNVLTVNDVELPYQRTVPAVLP